MLFFVFRPNQSRLGLKSCFIVFLGKEVLSQMMCSGIYIFSGIGAFGGFGVLTLW